MAIRDVKKLLERHSKIYEYQKSVYPFIPTIDEIAVLLGIVKSATWSLLQAMEEFGMCKSRRTSDGQRKYYIIGVDYAKVKEEIEESRKRKNRSNQDTRAKKNARANRP